MSKRLLGPVGGPVVFFLVAALAFAGLGWVTVVALRVEQAQRETAAQAELASNLRVAMRQLDNRMLPTLSGEDNRPFYHYSSADPLSGSTAGPTPLLANPLPDWMKLHVQLDPASGWESPQVLTPAAAERVKLAWPDLDLRNNVAGRADALRSLRTTCPPAPTCALLAERDRAIPDGSFPFAAPLFTNNEQSYAEQVPAAPPSSQPKPPPPDLGPVSGLPPTASPESFTLFGQVFRQREAIAANQRDGKKANEKQEVSPPAPAAPGVSQSPVAQRPPRAGTGGAALRCPTTTAEGATTGTARRRSSGRFRSQRPRAKTRCRGRTTSRAS